MVRLGKTDLNCCRSSLALPRLSFTSWQPSLSGATPELSYLFLFTRFQNGSVLLLSSPSLILPLVWLHSALLHSRLLCF